MPPKKGGKAKKDQVEPVNTKTVKTSEKVLEQVSQKIASIRESQTPKKYDLNNILTKQFLEEGKTTEQLVKQLETIGDALKEVSQSDEKFTEWEDEFPQYFLDKKYIQHKDTEVKLRLACVFAEIFRLTAPEHPYESDQVRKIFKLFIAQFNGLDDIDDPLFSSYFYLLEKLASIKVFLVLSDPELDASDLVEELFTTFFQILSAKYEQKVSGYMSEIMISLIEAIDQISPRLLEILLTPLITKTDDPSGSNLARHVLDKSADYIVTNLTEYLIKELNVLDKTKAKYKTKRAHIFAILAELNAISSRLLLYIMPSISGMIKDEDEQERAAVVQLLGRMFSLKESTLVYDYKQTVDEFFGRLSDAEPSIRTIMIKQCVQLVNSHPTLSTRVCELYEARLMDVDEKVRRCVVESIVALTLENPSHVTDTLLVKAGERFRDKKEQLRVHAMKLFAGLYRKYPHNDKFAWIPEKIVMQYGDKSFGVEHASVIDEILINDLIPDISIVKDVATMFHQLSTNGKRAFERILLQKKNLVDSFKKAKTNDEFAVIIEKNFKKMKISDSHTGIIKKSIADSLNRDQINTLDKEVDKMDNDIFKQVWLRICPLFTVEEMKTSIETIPKDGFEFVKFLSKNFPHLFSTSIENLCKILNRDAELALYVLQNVSGVSDKKFSQVLIKKLDDDEPKIVKYSIRILLKNYGDLVKKIFDNIITRLESEDFDRVEFDLIMLSQFATYKADIFKVEAPLLVDILIENFERFASNGIDVLVAYLELLAREGISLNSEVMQKKIFPFLFDSLSYAETSIKCAATSGLIKLSTIGEYQRAIFKPKEFLQLTYMVLDPDVDLDMIDRIFNFLSLYKLPLKYAAILFLSQREEARLHTQALVQHLYHVNMIQSPPINLSDEKSVKFCPEYIFPILVHVLVNHPNFDEEEPQFVDFAKILFHFFDSVLHDNLSFFHQLIAKLKLRKDIMKLETLHCQKVCDLASAVLNAKTAEGKYSLQMYPGKIYVPPYFKEAEGINLSTLYLDHDFKLNEKKKSTGSPRKKKEGESPKRKRQEAKSPKKKKKTSDEDEDDDVESEKEEFISPRTKLTRGAKVSKAQDGQKDGSDSPDDDGDNSDAYRQTQENQKKKGGRRATTKVATKKVTNETKGSASVTPKKKITKVPEVEEKIVEDDVQDEMEEEPDVTFASRKMRY